MKNISLIITVILFTCFQGIAQPGDRRERIHAIKVNYITDRIKLTPEQAEKFWPVYNRYEGELRASRRELMKKYPDKNGARNELESRRFIEDNIEYREERLRLEKKYKNEFLRLISAQQLAELYVAERDFKRMLIQNLEKRRGGKKGGPPGR